MLGNESMFPFLAPSLTRIWGPFRLLESYLVLIGAGAALAALLTWWVLPRLWDLLPEDPGRVDAVQGEGAKGKPTGAGIICVSLLMPVLLLVLPVSLPLWEIVACLWLVMITGYLDDRSELPWGEYRKGLLDLVVAGMTSLAICQGKAMTIWLPFYKDELIVSPWVYVPAAAVILWVMINATNCSDGVDGLAGSLTLLSLFYLGGFLYLVVGHRDFAAYLLLPHNPDGAKWAVLVFASAGTLVGYLWHNASPSAVLMGDAGSRFFGLLVGVAVLASGNPLLVLVVAPVALVNGGTGLVKVVLLRVFRKLGFDTRSPAQTQNGDSAVDMNETYIFVKLLHRYRFPLHDHCRKELHWSNAQVLMRFLLLQTLLTPILLGVFVKVR